MRFVYFALLFIAAAHARFMLRQGRTLSEIPRSIETKKAMTIDFMQDIVKKHAVPGYALSVVYKNQTIIAQGFGTKQYGNASNVVTPDTPFQIGSYTKTFIALAIAKLVDEGKMDWTDSVKQHLPWFKLQDKYAEEYTTIGDLLAMNSVFGDHEGDFVLMVDAVSGERDLIEKLAYFKTTQTLRPGYAYSNLNYEILGQVIEYATNMTWGAYLDATFFKPLGMHHTYSRALDVPNADDLSYGHNFCNDKVAGPYHLQSSPEIYLRQHNDYMSAGSILSTASDLSIFSRFLLSKGEGIFNTSEAISDMITGHSISTAFTHVAPLMGFSYTPDGNAITAGYGFDVVGDVMFGYHYFDKGGDTVGFKTRNGFVPSEELGVVLLSNAEAKGGAVQDGMLQERMRSYILGIFLDIPKDELQKSYDDAIEPLKSIPPTECNAHYFDGKSWDDIGQPIPQDKLAPLQGTYTATISTKYYGNVTISIANDTALLSYGVYTAPLYYASDNTTTSFLWANDLAMGGFAPLDIIQTSWNATINWGGIEFVKEGRSC